LQWLAFAATGCMVLLGTTQMLTLNISPMPFLWVLPLGIYLVSYILVFSGFKFYVRIYYYPIFGFCLMAALLMFFLGGQFSSLSQILMYLFILFISCMICHGELRLLAPHTDNLPLFYLVVAAGGLLGSLFVSLWAPAIFTSLTEYPIAIFCVYIMAASSISKKHRKHYLIWAVGLFTLPVAYLLLHNAYSRFDIANTRNFYGYLSVKDVATEQGISRRLVDGSTLHGSQSMQTISPSTVGYYAENTGISIAIQHSQQQANMQMAVIGLGAGVLAKYGRKGDVITFYEINPAVKKFAQTYFTYLTDSSADIDITLGDGRISLQNKLTHSPANNLDILVIDAFTSDAIPIHLLTYEAFQLYWQLLEENGLLVIHISNNHLDLKPVIYTLGKEFNKQSLFFKTYQTSTTNYGSEWMVITSNMNFVSTPTVLKHAIKFEIKKDATFHWTDNFSSVLSVLKL
jgi:spermidine synthase